MIKRERAGRRREGEIRRCRYYASTVSSEESPEVAVVEPGFLNSAVHVIEGNTYLRLSRHLRPGRGESLDLGRR